jgi:hypothetical protein
LYSQIQHHQGDDHSCCGNDPVSVTDGQEVRVKVSKIALALQLPNPGCGGIFGHNGVEDGRKGKAAVGRLGIQFRDWVLRGLIRHLARNGKTIHEIAVITSDGALHAVRSFF